MPAFLIVDDSSTLRKMIMAALKPLRPVFGEAGSGLEAIEQLTLRPYDAMTLDLNMPDMHGLELLRFLRSHKVFQSIPIVVVTTRSDSESREAVMAAGADRYICKPFDPSDLLKEVNEILG